MATAGGHSVTSDDTQYDAEAEAFHLDPSNEDSEYDPNLFSKGRDPEETGIKTGQRTNNLPKGTVDSERIMIDYKHFLPEDIKHDDSEILILSADTDEDEAMALKEGIENNVMFCGTLKPNVILLKDFIPINNDGDHLNEAFKRTLYVVLYVTEEFCKHSWHLFQSHACLKRALTSTEEQWSIIPVHTSPKNKRKYELPLMLDGLRPLNCFSKTFYQDVKNLLEHKSNVILGKRANLFKKRQQYIGANSEKFRCLSMATENLMSTMKMPKNQSELPAELPVKVSVSNRESQNRTYVKAQDQYQAVDFNHRSSHQETKNTSPLQQQQQEMNQQVLVSAESSGMKKSYLRPKSYETDYSLGVTTDSPSSAETCGEASEKDVSPEDSNQLGMSSRSGCNKSCYSSSVRTSAVEYSSLGEPPDDKAVPENPNLNAFPTAESDVSRTGSHIHQPTGQGNTYSHREASDIVSEDGNLPNIQAFPSNPVRGVPRNGRSRFRRSDNASPLSGKEIHIHIQATNVAIGRRSTLNVISALHGNEDSDNSEESEDSENANSFEI